MLTYVCAMQCWCKEVEVYAIYGIEGVISFGKSFVKQRVASSNTRFCKAAELTHFGHSSSIE